MVEQLPFISVILTTWNRKNDLRECLESLLAQDYPKDRFEVLVVCDPSTDGTEEMLRGEYAKNPNVKVFINPRKTTLPQTRNIGLRAARGDLVELASDDLVYYDRQMFRKFARSFGETPGVGMVGGRWERIGNPWLCKYNELYEELNYPLRGENRGEYWLGGDEVLRVNGCEVLAIPKSVFDRVGPYDEKFQWGGEDSELRGRILQAGYKLKYDLRLSAKHKMRGTLHAFARREFRLGEAAAQWNRRFPSKMSLKHKAGLAILVPFALALVYSILAALAGLPFLAEAAGAALFIPAAVLVFFALDALRYAAFPLAGATPADRASFFFLRMVQSWATYLGLAKKTFLG